MLERLLTLDEQLTLALNGSSSLFWDGVAVVATATTTWLLVAAVLLYVLFHNRPVKEAVVLLLMIALCVLLADQVASGICKPYFARFRPAQDPALMYTVDVVNGYRGGAYGFFSSHAANTFSVALFLSLVFRHAALTVALMSWSLLNCWTRAYLGVHYVGDLTVGLLWGTVVGLLVYFVYRKLYPFPPSAEHRADIQTTSGYAISDIYLLLSSLLFTYLLVLLLAFIV